VKITDLLRFARERAEPIFSFEFFPPKTPEGERALFETVDALRPLAPAYVSVTYGAGGSTRQKTVDLVKRLKRDSEVEAMAHVTCVGASRDEIAAVLDEVADAGVQNVLALRGDPPRGETQFVPHPDGFRYASELVAFIRAETAGWFHVDVAAYPEYHPQARTPQDDLAAFKRKIDAGANSAITQYFFNADAYWRFVDDCAAIGIGVPIVPGVMPIGSFAKLARFSDNCGAEIPRWIRRKLEGFGDDTASIRAFGLDVVTELCAGLLARGAPGLHFYTLNQAGLTTTIWQRLGL
jgi:methylenetetrahydrofolate reductase (NADPH)